MLDTKYGLLPYIGQDWLVQQYNRLEIMRLEMWDKIYDVKKSVEDAGGSFDTSLIDSEALYRDGVLKIVVKDYPPRSCLVMFKTSQKPLRYKWLKTVVDAINKLKNKGINPFFDKAHCIITVYLPRSANSWDIDNRAFKFVIDGLRYGGVITDDSADKLALTVIGEVDKSYPRTEIIVVEHRLMMELIEKYILVNIDIFGS